MGRRSNKISLPSKSNKIPLGKNYSFLWLLPLFVAHVYDREEKDKLMSFILTILYIRSNLLNDPSWSPSFFLYLFLLIFYCKISNEFYFSLFYSVIFFLIFLVLLIVVFNCQCFIASECFFLGESEYSPHATPTLCMFFYTHGLRIDPHLDWDPFKGLTSPNKYYSIHTTWSNHWHRL